MMEPKYITNLSDERYHANRDLISNSHIKLWRDDRRRYEDEIVRRIKPPPISDEMVLGNYVEALVFRDEESVRSRFVVMPEDPNKPGKPIRRDKRAQAWKDFLVEAGKRQQLTPAYAELATAMVQALAEHPEAGPLLVKGRGDDQPVFVWTCDETGVDHKGKPDRVIVAEDLIIDLKTDQDPRPIPQNEKRWFEWGYHRQLAMYIDGFTAAFGRNPRAALVMVANTPRPRVCVRWYETDSPAIEIGRIQYQESALEIAACRRAGDYRYPWERAGIPGAVPEWALRQYDIVDTEGVERASEEAQAANG